MAVVWMHMCLWSGPRWGKSWNGKSHALISDRQTHNAWCSLCRKDTKWGKMASPNCLKCPCRGMLERILSCCLLALGQGLATQLRYENHHRSIILGISSRGLCPTTRSLSLEQAGEHLTRSSWARCMSIKVSCSRIVGQSLYKTLSELDITRVERRRVIKNIIEEAKIEERASGEPWELVCARWTQTESDQLWLGGMPLKSIQDF